MTSVAYEAPSRTGRPPLLEWRPALAASFVSWVATLMCIGAIGIPASELGLIARPRGSGLRDWPYPEAGQASLAANAVVWFLMIALTALLIRVVLTANGARPVPWVTVFAVLATTGFVPFLPHGLLDAPWLVALLLTAALLRFSSALELPPVPKRLSVVAIAAAGLLLLVPALHAVRHPLWAGSTVLDGGPNSVTFSVRNAGFAAVELEAVSLRLPGPRASLVETGGVRADMVPTGSTRRAVSRIAAASVHDQGSRRSFRSPTPESAVLRQRHAADDGRNQIPRSWRLPSGELADADRRSEVLLKTVSPRTVK